MLGGCRRRRMQKKISLLILVLTLLVLLEYLWTMDLHTRSMIEPSVSSIPLRYQKSWKSELVIISNLSRSPLGVAPPVPHMHSTTPAPPPPPVSSRSGRGSGSGYVLATHYEDQLTAGSVNLLSLQCWASSLRLGRSVKTVEQKSPQSHQLGNSVEIVEQPSPQSHQLGISVKTVEPPLSPQSHRLGRSVKTVEPFICDGSHWGLEDSLSQDPVTPRLRDVFDASRWSRYAKRHMLSPLVNWEEFLKKAPKNMIVVGRDCKNGSHNNTASRFAKRYGFQIVRDVVIDCATMFSAAKFKSLIYGNYMPADAVVLFDYWPGIAKTLSPSFQKYRIPITDLERCVRGSEMKKFMDFVPQSRRIIENGRHYIERYLPSEDGYIAVMFRLEQLFVRRQLRTETSQIRSGKRCIKSILQVVKRLRKTGPTGDVFLAMDTGKYGSQSFRKWNSTAPYKLSRDLFTGIYGEKSSTTFEVWEDSFSSVADFSTPGYVAMLQLNVAVRATELILVGGGSFQSIAAREIKYRHQSDARVHRIKEC